MTTYFVANAGLDTNNGTASGTPFKTIAKVVSVALGGDTILLNRGDRWFESLAIPHSSITVDAYGAAAAFDAMGYCTNAPILDQGAAATGWSAYTGGVTVTQVSDTFTGTTGLTLASHVPNVGTAWAINTNYNSAAQLTASGTVRPTVNGANTQTFYYCTPTPISANQQAQADVIFKTIVAGENAGVGARFATGARNGYLGRLGSDGTAVIHKVVGGTYTTLATTAAGAVTVVAGTAYTVLFTANGSTLTLSVNGTQLLSITDTTYNTGDTGVWLFSNAGVSDTTNVQLDNFSTGPPDPGPPVNTYQASLPTQTLLVDHNQTYCFQGNGVNSLADQQYYWYQNILYFRNNAGLPNNTEVVVGQRANGVSASSFTGLTVQNIAVEHSNDSAYYFNICAGVLVNSCYGQRTSHWINSAVENGFINIVGASNNAVVQHCFGRFIGADGIYFNTGSSPQALYNTFYQLYEGVTNGIAVDASTPANGVVIRGNVMTFPSSSVGPNSDSTKGGIINFSANALIERNYVAYGPLFGITLPANGTICRDNVLYRCGSGPFYTALLGAATGGGGIRFGTNGGVNLSGQQVYRNLCLDCPTGIWGSIDSTFTWTGVLIANNTIVNINVAPTTADFVTGYTVSAGGGFQVALGRSGTGGFGGTFENNVLWNFTGSGGAISLPAISGSWASDHNLIGPDATGEFSFTGTIYNTLAAYSAGKSQDAHSSNATPTFSNKGYTPASQPPIVPSDSILAYRNAWRSAARHLAVVVSGVTQMGAPDAGLEATYGYWGTAA